MGCAAATANTQPSSALLQRLHDVSNQLMLCPAFAERVHAGAHNYKVVTRDDGNELSFVSRGGKGTRRDSGQLIEQPELCAVTADSGNRRLERRRWCTGEFHPSLGEQSL